MHGQIQAGRRELNAGVVVTSAGEADRNEWPRGADRRRAGLGRRRSGGLDPGFSRG